MLRLLKELKHGLKGGIVTKLPKRQIFHIEGSDTYEFLNGLVCITGLLQMTKQVTNKITKTGETNAIYAAFLNKKGRMMADSLLYHRPGTLRYLVPFSPNPKLFR